jgi:hypothetical protein
MSTRPCFECYHGEPEGRVKDSCPCVWPMMFGRKKEIIECPTEGDCAAFVARKDVEGESEFVEDEDGQLTIDPEDDNISSAEL